MDDLRFYVLFNSILVISGRWEVNNERLCAIKGLSFGSKDYNKELKTVECVHIFWTRLACFGQLGLISDPQISQKLQNGFNDAKGLENKIYTMMKGRKTFLR